MNKQSLKEQLLLREIPIDDKKLDSLMDLMKTTLKTNEKFNLTAIKDEESFLEKMIFDSAIALEELDLNDKKVLAEIFEDI